MDRFDASKVGMITKEFTDLINPDSDTDEGNNDTDNFSHSKRKVLRYRNYVRNIQVYIK